MADITKETVKKIARLSRLELKEEEVEQYARSLGDILSYAEKINEADCADAPFMAGAAGLKNVFREDEEKPSLAIEKTLRNAPDAKDRFFKVPKIIEE